LDALRDGSITPVVVDAVMREWTRHSDPGVAIQYARIIDSSQCQLEAADFSSCPLGEALNSIGRRKPHLPLQGFDLIGPLNPANPLHIFLLRHLHSNQQEVQSHLSRMPLSPSPRISVEDRVRMLLRNAQALRNAVWPIAHSGDLVCFNDTKNTLATHRPKEIFQEEVIKRWLSNQLRLNDILTSALPSEDPSCLLSLVKLSECPGLMLYFHTYVHFVSATRDHDPTDFVDQVAVPAFAYCDHVLVDKRTRNFVQQALRRLPQIKVRIYDDIKDLPCFATRCARSVHHDRL
jgi:hypothetical protein